MFYYDYHVHTNFSSDSKETPEDMIKQAISLNLKEIAITDHVDYDNTDVPSELILKYEDYSAKINSLIDLYKDDIDIKLGVEIGMQPHIAKKCTDFCKNNHFDFIIASTHAIDKRDVYNGKIFEEHSQKEGYKIYFENVLENVTLFDEFDVFGHLDFINRYGKFEDKTLNYIDFKDIIDEILKVIIKKNKGIEINTSGFKYGLGHTHPKIEIVKRYKELGGEIITLGSDSHAKKMLTSHFDVVYDMLVLAGFKYFTSFKDRKPEFISIEKFKM